MNAIAGNAGAMNLSARESGGDPLRFVIVGDISRKKIGFSAPIWESPAALGVAWIATAISCVSVISMYPVFKKVTVGLVVLAVVTVLSGMVFCRTLHRELLSCSPPALLLSI